MSGYLDCKELCSLIQKIYSNLMVKYTNKIAMCANAHTNQKCLNGYSMRLRI